MHLHINYLYKCTYPLLISKMHKNELILSYLVFNHHIEILKKNRISNIFINFWNSILYIKCSPYICIHVTSKLLQYRYHYTFVQRLLYILFLHSLEWLSLRININNIMINSVDWCERNWNIFITIHPFYIYNIIYFIIIFNIL